ncbi:MAG TPA: RsmG family class I SAM-dependent methyltransferase, partial [Gammaproteobacteria bacterium]|nr:RsmG family class I SAM-dependent methyltransferase [Gammaproteobacteria bacterium]
LLDSNEKRQIFLKQVVHQLHLPNVQLYCTRVENFNASFKFSCIVARAFKPLAEMLRLVQHLLSSDGSIVAMKGKIEEKELKEIDPKFKIDRIITLQNTSQAPQRHLIIIKFEQTT